MINPINITNATLRLTDSNSFVMPRSAKLKAQRNTKPGINVRYMKPMHCLRKGISKPIDKNERICTVNTHIVVS
jgi:hypothetical protein